MRVTERVAHRVTGTSDWHELPTELVESPFLEAVWTVLQKMSGHDPGQLHLEIQDQ